MKLKTLLKYTSQGYNTLFALIALCVGAALASDRFLQLPNLLNIGRQISIIGIAALGATYVIITSGIDLSVGPVMVIGSMVVGVCQWYPILVVVLLSLLAGMVCGAVNGFLVTQVRIPPFIATFGMSGVWGGIAYITSTGIRVVIHRSDWWFVGSGMLFRSIPFPLALYAALALGAGIALSKTAFGTLIYGLGVNETALKFAGVKTNRQKLLVYMVAGGFAAAAGVVLAGRIREADPGLAFVFTLDVIAAVVLGGTRLEGGRGGIPQTIIGTAIIGVLNNIMNLLNVSSFYQQSIKGALILVILGLMGGRKVE